MLARPFSLRGEIVSGRGIGSRQTVPTLNLSAETELRPAQGVYVTFTCDLESSRRWGSVTNVGSRPTFNGTDQTVETYLLEGLEGRKPSRIELAFLHRLRDERRFETPEKLRRQILKDAGQAKRYFRLLGAAKRPHQPKPGVRPGRRAGPRIPNAGFPAGIDARAGCPGTLQSMA